MNQKKPSLLLWHCGSHSMNLTVPLNGLCFLKVTDMINDTIQFSAVSVLEWL